MKKQLIALFIGLMTITVVAQKNELKTAEKALKKADIKTASAALDAAEALENSMEPKLKSKFYFLKGQLLKSKKEYKGAADAFNKLTAYEAEIGKKKYTSKVKPLLNEIIQEASNAAIKYYNVDKDYKNAAEGFYLTYRLNKKDTSFLYNAAVSATQAKEYETSLAYYKELKEVGYTGITTSYMAKNKETGEEENLGSKAQRDLMVKSGQYTDPKDTTSPSKRADIIESIGLILTQQGKTDEAIVAIQEARKANPKDLNLLLTEADLYIKLDRMDMFGKLMEEAVTVDPTNPNLFYNLGVVSFNQKDAESAKKYYKKAIELKPDYADAYTNLAVAILSKEESIVEEMNNNLSNFKKYDALEKEQKNLYKEALPYLEKSDQYKRTIDSVRGLLNIYDTLEMDEKSSEYRALYKSMKE